MREGKRDMLKVMSGKGGNRGKGTRSNPPTNHHAESALVQRVRW